MSEFRDEKRIKIAKGAEPAGGRRLEVEDQTSPTDPIKRRAEHQSRSKLKSVCAVELV